MNAKQKTNVESLLDLAALAGQRGDPIQAINYTQAACNAANALRVLAEIERAEASQEVEWWK